MFGTSKPTAASLAKQRKALATELQRLRDEEQQILEESTERRIEVNRVKVRDAMAALYEVEKAENSLVSSAEPSAREKAIVEEIRTLYDRERQLTLDGSSLSIAMPSRYIRPDAVEFFSAEHNARVAELARLNQEHFGGNRNPGQRIRAEISELEDAIRKWPNVLKLVRIGERIALCRRDRELLSEEKRQLESQRRKDALAA